MRNPFEELFAPKLENPEGEEVGGAFSCQHDDCWTTATEARYVEEVELLTWKCPNGHYNKIERFKL